MAGIRMNKSILITGSTGNLGSVAVEYFQRIGWNVTGVSRSQFITPTHTVDTGLDLKYPNEIDTLVSSLSRNYDIVFITHGIVDSARLTGLDWLKIKEVVDTNLGSCIFLTSQLIKRNRLNPNALIVYCSSIQADLPREGRYLYGLSKLGLELLAKSVHVEHAPKVRAVALRLGQMEKLMAGRQFTDDERKAIEEYTPLPWVNCLEVCKLVECLYGQSSLSGTTINVDSGHNLSVWPK